MFDVMVQPGVVRSVVSVPPVHPPRSLSLVSGVAPVRRCGADQEQTSTGGWKHS